MAIGAKCAAPSFAGFLFPAGNLEGSPKDSLTKFEDYFQQPNLSSDFGSASRALLSVVSDISSGATSTLRQA